MYIYIYSYAWKDCVRLGTCELLWGRFKSQPMQKLINEFECDSDSAYMISTQPFDP